MKEVTLPEDVDAECRVLCDAMNKLSGIRTIESCCGHGRRPFRIWFNVKSVGDLPPILYWFDECHSGVGGWRIIATTDCGMSPVTFRAEGAVGDYEGALRIAACLEEQAKTFERKELR